MGCVPVHGSGAVIAFALGELSMIDYMRAVRLGFDLLQYLSRRLVA
jgi:hypothetical protein